MFNTLVNFMAKLFTPTAKVNLAALEEEAQAQIDLVNRIKARLESRVRTERFSDIVRKPEGK